MSKFEEIDEFLDIEPIDVPKKNQIKKIEKKDDPTLDYEYSRGNLYSLIEKGQEAINGILELAQDGQQPRAYEVAGQLIKSVGDTTDKLIDLQTKMKELKKEDDGSPKTVNNALFVGSTSELSKLLKKGVLNNKVEKEEE
tara:strand:- start:629 stop:1048 length:420 start_codon:yes stop_codon:yes gene_type:complete